MKGVSLPVNVIIIMALGLVVVMGIALFVTGGIFESGSEIAKQQIMTDCCLRACRKPDNFKTEGSDIRDSRDNLKAIVCATSSSTDWEEVSQLDAYPEDDTVTLWELGGGTDTNVNSELVSTVNRIKGMCGC